MKLHPLVKLFHMMEHVAHGEKPHGPHESVCTLMSRKKGEKEADRDKEKRNQMIKQTWEGAVSLKKKKEQ